MDSHPEGSVNFKFKLSRRLAAAHAVSLLVAVSFSCERGITSQAPPELVRVTASPRSVTLSPGAHTGFSAQGITQYGDTIPVPVLWTASDGTISPSGIFFAPDSAVEVAIIAQSSEKSWLEDTARVSVATLNAPPAPGGSVASVFLSPVRLVLGVGSDGPMTATLRDGAGRPVSGPAIRWSIDDSTVAGVTSDGRVTGRAVGTATVTATTGSVSGQASVVVNPSAVAAVVIQPDTLVVPVARQAAAAATTFDSAGSPLANRLVIWGTANPGVATVDRAGRVTGVSAGVTTIDATVEGQVDSAVVRVVPVAVSAVTVVPGIATIAVGDTVPLAAYPIDSVGSAINGRATVWATSDPVVASVSPSGVVVGRQPGAVSVRANVGGVTGISSITVQTTVGAVTSVTVQPTPSTVTVGATRRYTATARDSAGTPLGGRPVTWTVADPTVATVDSTGLVTGLLPGSTQITATVNGVIGTAGLTVIPVPVASVLVSPDSLNVPVSATGQLAALVLDSVGNPLTGRSLTWQSGDPAVATVNATGTVSGVAPGTVTVTAAAGGRTGSATVVVPQPSPGSIVVTPAVDTVVTGATVQLSAVVRDSLGTIVPGAVVGWSTSDATVATVSSGGLVTGTGPGLATLVASLSGVTGSSRITVLPAPVASVVVSPNPATLFLGGGSSAFTATARDGAGGVIPGRTFTWTTADPSVATVNAAGQVQPVAVGSTTVTARTGGVSGTSTVTVIVAGSFEPAGYTPIVGRRFNTLAATDPDRGTGSLPYKTGGSEGWDGFEYSQSNLSIASDPAAPLSPSSVLRIHYAANRAGGVSPGTAQSLPFRSGYGATPRELYMSYAFKASTSFYGHPTSTNKIFFYWVAGGPRVFDRLVGTGMNPLRYQVALQGTAPTCETRTRLTGNRGASATIARGQWYHVELQMVLNSAGSCNGLVRVWLNGVLLMEYTNVGILAAGEASGRWDQLQLRPVWGGGGSTTPQAFDLWIDHAYVSGR